MKTITRVAILGLFLMVLTIPVIAGAQYYNYNNSACTYHAYMLCVGNSIYWYGSCGDQQDLYLTCSGGQTCQYGQCVAYVQPTQPIQPSTNYIAHARTACYGNTISWYDSLGVASGLYQNCQDTNSCTIDSCSANKCSNILKCDGTTCANNSVDYKNYCQQTPVQSSSSSSSSASSQSSNSSALNISANGLSVSFFSKQDSASTQWQKTTQLGSNSQIYFMISLANNSTEELNNVNISANIPTEISSLGNLQLNGVLVSGDIVSGINVGSISPATTKLLTFEGKTETISAESTKQATATTTISGATKSDSVSINFNASQATAPAAVSKAQTATGFMGFLGRWYMWILGGLVLIFLFIVVFKRFSSEV